jgi:5'-deoxynucleotidase YfbR-like HD superfamily hydrolase
VKKTLWEEKFKKFESFLTGVEDPFDKASKIEDALELFWTKEGGKGGSGVPDNGGNAGKIAEFKSRLEKGEALSPNERQEYIKLLSEKK